MSYLDAYAPPSGLLALKRCPAKLQKSFPTIGLKLNYTLIFVIYASYFTFPHDQYVEFWYAQYFWSFDESTYAQYF